MTGFKRFGFYLLCTAFALLFSSAVQAQEMTYEEYKVELAKYEARTVEAKKAQTECTKATEDLAKQLSDLDGQIASMRDEIYQLVGADEGGINNYIGELDKTQGQMMGLLNLSEEGLFDRRDEIDALEALLKELKGDKRSALPDAQGKIKSIEQLLERLKSKMPRKQIRQYTVAKGDCLWNIAKKPDIYNDAYMWPRIYVENRSVIKDPDLIYPQRVLNVPFGVDLNQHLVLRGQHLSSIAGVVYKDVTKWHKLYQANKSQILEPSLIFPAQVLDVPAN